LHVQWRLLYLSDVSFRSLVSFGPAAGVVIHVSGILAAYINSFPSSLGCTLPCHAWLLMDNIHLLVGSYWLLLGIWNDYILLERVARFFSDFKAGSDCWENSTPSGLVVVTQPKKVTGPHYDPVAFVNDFEILPFVGYLWLVRLCLSGRIALGTGSLGSGFSTGNPCRLLG
jgi:hypothetical protein